MASTISYNNNIIKTINEIGIITLSTNGKIMDSDIIITLDGNYNIKLRYNEFDILDANNGIYILKCSKQLMNSNIQIIITENSTLSRTTYFYLTLPSSGLKKSINWWQDGKNIVTVDWGDGSPQETSNTSGVTSLSHTYEAAGDYILSMTVDEDMVWAPGGIFMSFLNVTVSKSTTSPELTAIQFGDGIFFSNADACGSSAFINCTSLTFIEFPNGVEEIPASICQNCTGLTDIIIPNSVKKICDSSFSSCSGLGPNLELFAQTIERYAFYNCKALRKVWIRDSVEFITVSQDNDNYCGPFTACSEDLVIYCEADNKPSNWDEYWNHRTGANTLHTVIWGQKTKPW